MKTISTEELGEPFSKVLFDNLAELYAESGNIPYDKGSFTLQKEALGLVPFQALCFIKTDQELEEYVLARIQDHLQEVLPLIDNFAETRHTCGHWTYNIKSSEARQKVIAALKGE